MTRPGPLESAARQRVRDIRSRIYGADAVVADDGVACPSASQKLCRPILVVPTPLLPEHEPKRPEPATYLMSISGTVHINGSVSVDEEYVVQTWKSTPIVNGSFEPRRRVRIYDVQMAVCKYYGMERNDLLSQRRTKAIVRPRQVAMYLCKKLTLMSLPQIGRRFDNRDHTTVLHAISKVTALIEDDPEIATDVEELTRFLENA